MVWSASGIQSPLGRLELGPVVANLSCKDSVLAASGEQNSPQVSAAFSAELMPNQRYSTKAWFKPGAEFPSAMGISCNGSVSQIHKVNMSLTTKGAFK